MTDLTWEEPTSDVNSEWTELRDALKARPGKWARISRQPNTDAARAVSEKLRRLGCETSRRIQKDTTYNVYARWPEDQ